MFERFTRFGREIRRLHETRLEYAKQVQGSERELHDPIEDDPLYQGFLQAAESETDEELRSAGRGLGFCHRLWKTKQTILVRKYGVIWFSPSEMNPHILFD
jgi:hypothetical protein